MSVKHCQHCGTDKAVGHVKTTSPTGSYSREFDLCMPEIVDLERWITKTKNAKGETPELVYVK